MVPRATPWHKLSFPHAVMANLWGSKTLRGRGCEWALIQWAQGGRAEVCQDMQSLLSARGKARAQTSRHPRSPRALILHRRSAYHPIVTQGLLPLQKCWQHGPNLSYGPVIIADFVDAHYSHCLNMSQFSAASFTRSMFLSNCLVLAQAIKSNMSTRHMSLSIDLG